MKRGIVGGVAALLMAAGLIVSAPSASAGCLYGGPVLSKCDGPVQPDGTWQRCVATTRWVPSGMSTYLVPDKHCDQMGPDQHPADLAFADPPTHIDD
ncbi:MAG TPA: hypothetical protein VFA16_05740 [Mycobacterium sp.]|uniref:CDGP domain-containing protein n=1 Tax=Mycobacterium sp. TaxID=1785 RepID=UPI002D75D88B|nr:hypothetical protein [Mycobacterium sp.]HZU46747.1 hypothetical protein [Mycobacterium sp.]